MLGDGHDGEPEPVAADVGGGVGVGGAAAAGCDAGAGVSAAGDVERSGAGVGVSAERAESLPVPSLRFTGPNTDSRIPAIRSWSGRCSGSSGLERLAATGADRSPVTLLGLEATDGLKIELPPADVEDSPRAPGPDKPGVGAPGERSGAVEPSGGGGMTFVIGVRGAATTPAADREPESWGLDVCAPKFPYRSVAEALAVPPVLPYAVPALLLACL